MPQCARQGYEKADLQVDVVVPDIDVQLLTAGVALLDPQAAPEGRLGLLQRIGPSARVLATVWQAVESQAGLVGNRENCCGHAKLCQVMLACLVLLSQPRELLPVITLQACRCMVRARHKSWRYDDLRRTGCIGGFHVHQPYGVRWPSGRLGDGMPCYFGS